MYGKVIGTSIAVNCFEEVTQNGIYFLTEGELKGPVPTHVDRLYTSAHNAWILQTRFQVDEDKVVGLPMNEKLRIQDKIKQLDFYVTLVDAKQQPGAVMFLFEGEDIGNILYAGKCCFSEDFFTRPLRNFLKEKVLDYLYIHSSCVDCQLHSLSMTGAVEEIVKIVRLNANCKVIIYEPYFREDILTYFKKIFRKPICVSENIMTHLEDVGHGPDFTLDISAAQVIITDQPHSRKQNCYGEQSDLKIILIPCSMKRSAQDIYLKLHKMESNGYSVILYRNHCSPPELASLVQHLKPKHTVLIKPPPVADLAKRKKDVNYWSHLGDFRKVVEFCDDNDPSLEVCQELCDDELDHAVDCIVKNPQGRMIETDQSNDDISLENAAPNTFILIDSESESMASRETVLNISAV